MIILADVIAWPDAVVGCVGFICLASFLMERWPWQKTEIHYDCECEGCKGEDKEDDEI